MNIRISTTDERKMRALKCVILAMNEKASYNLTQLVEIAWQYGSGFRHRRPSRSMIRELLTTPIADFFAQ